MIKKTTKVIFKDGKDEKTEELVGGIPLSKGEIIKVHKNNKIIEYEVVDKIIDCFLDGADQNVDITYIVEKKR
jgi:hypothetical protein